MHYHTNKNLPEAIQKVLPEHAQTLYREAFNEAYHENYDRNSSETQVAEEAGDHAGWEAVEEHYQKGQDGHWHPNA